MKIEDKCLQSRLKIASPSFYSELNILLFYPQANMFLSLIETDRPVESGKPVFNVSLKGSREMGSPDKHKCTSVTDS